MKLSEMKRISLGRVIVKAFILIVLFNFLFISFINMPYGKLTLYNTIFDGRSRLPFGENPQESFNLTMNNLDAMISSHRISDCCDDNNKYKIVLLGDSSIWGFLQEPNQTLSAELQRQTNFHCNQKEIEIYNLGYPSLSVLKDLMVLEKVKDFKPDLVIWFITLESMVDQDQLSIPIVKNNPHLVNELIKNYSLQYPIQKINLMDYSLIGQRRNLADLVRLQLYGVIWAGSGVDHVFPDEFIPAQRDFEQDANFKNFYSKTINTDDLAINVIVNTVDKLSDINFVIINEPILISNGRNSHLRYNYYYPRWAYDEYRKIIKSEFEKNKIKYFDYWNTIPESEFTNSAIHLNEKGEQMLAGQTRSIVEQVCKE